MAVTKGRYQTDEGFQNDETVWLVIDTRTEEWVASCRFEAQAIHVANALNFDNKPSDYGYHLNTEKDADR